MLHKISAQSTQINGGVGSLQNQAKGKAEYSHQQKNESKSVLQKKEKDLFHQVCDYREIKSMIAYCNDLRDTQNQQPFQTNCKS